MSLFTLYIHDVLVYTHCRVDFNVEGSLFILKLSIKVGYVGVRPKFYVLCVLFTLGLLQYKLSLRELSTLCTAVPG